MDSAAGPIATNSMVKPQQHGLTHLEHLPKQKLEKLGGLEEWILSEEFTFREGTSTYFALTTLLMQSAKTSVIPSQAY
jgi:hypothetical protein